MQILVLAATKLEIAPFIKKKIAADILITGVGAPAALYKLQQKLYQKKYDLVVQAGIAGMFGDSLTLGETVLVERDCFADIGMQEKGIFTPIFKTGFVKPTEFPYKNGWLINKGIKAIKLTLKLVKAVTINTISDSTAQKKMLINNYGAAIESMEGAAFHYVCLQEKVTFLQLRAISNKVGVRDKTKWKIKEAIENLNNTLEQILQSYT